MSLPFKIAASASELNILKSAVGATPASHLFLLIGGGSANRPATDIAVGHCLSVGTPVYGTPQGLA
jgi:hypothetical protein